MNHRSIIKGTIIFVIGIVIIWSIFNISEYARRYHDSITVWSLGLALGLANALSVYAFVISSSNRSRTPAAIGIALFGGMSAILQWLLYLSAGAPMLAAVAFGCFGPVAEAVLSWLHAALSEDETDQQRREAERLKLEAEQRQRRDEEKRRRDEAKTQKEAAKTTQKPQLLPAEITPEQTPGNVGNEPQKHAAPELRPVPLTQKQAAILERRRQVAALTAQEIPQENIAATLRVSIRTVQEDLVKLRENATVATNGASH